MNEAALGAPGRPLYLVILFLFYQLSPSNLEVSFGDEDCVFYFYVLLYTACFKGCIRPQFLFLNKWIGESTNPRENKPGYGAAGQL